MRVRPSSQLTPDQRPGSTRTLLTPEQGGLVRRTVLPGGLFDPFQDLPGEIDASSRDLRAAQVYRQQLGGGIVKHCRPA